MNNLKLTGFINKLEYFSPDGVKQWECIEENIIPDDAIAYLLGSSLNSVSQLTAFYIGLFQTAYTPVATETMTTLLANATETTDYSGGVRLTLTPNAIAAGVFSNAGNQAEFVFTGDVTIRGSFITSNSVRGNNAGLLISADEYATAKVMEAGATLKVTTGLTLSRASI